MGFISLLFLWPLFLIGGLLSLLDIALPLIMPILLVWNLIVLAALLLVRRLWKKSGTMDRAYIDALDGWKRWPLLILRYGLLLFILWEVLLVIVCGIYVIWRPTLLGGPL